MVGTEVEQCCAVCGDKEGLEVGLIASAEDWKLFLIEIGAKLCVEEKALLRSRFGQLLGGEYGVSDVVFDSRIIYLYVDQFHSLY